MTAPIVLPIQRILLKKNGSRSRIDWACFIALVLLGLLKWSIMSALFFHQALSVVGIVLSTFLDLIIEPCNLLFYALIIRMVMSWLNPAWRDSFASLIVSITEPMLRPLRGILPNTGLFDFSPLVALIVIKALTLFVSGFLPIPLI